MKAGQIYLWKSDDRVGIRLESYLGNKVWVTLLIDMIDGRPTRTCLYDQAEESKILKYYKLYTK